jgi:hypothetical protein
MKNTLTRTGFEIDPHGVWVRVDDVFETRITRGTAAWDVTILNFDNDGEDDAEREALALDNAVMFRLTDDGDFIDGDGIDADTASAIFNFVN